MELHARDIQHHRFSTALRGYDRDEVAAYLEDIARHLSQLEEQLAIARTRAERAREELDSFNDVLDRRLEETAQARTAILDEARREAALITGAAKHGDASTIDAARTAAAIRKEAEVKAEARMREADEAVSEAHRRADTLMREAQESADLRLAEADRILDEARRTARTIRLDTERDRSEIEEHLAELRAILDAARTDGTSSLEDAKVILTKGSDTIIDLRGDAPNAVGTPAPGHAPALDSTVT